MNLQYKTHAYLRRAMYRAAFSRAEDGAWVASLPEFELEGRGRSQQDAEEALLKQLAFRISTATQLGFRLPVIEDIDLNQPTSTVEIDDSCFELLTGSERSSAYGDDQLTSEPLILTPKESRMVLDDIDRPPSSTEYMVRAMQKYSDFMSH